MSNANKPNPLHAKTQLCHVCNVMKPVLTESNENQEMAAILQRNTKMQIPFDKPDQSV